MLAICDCDSSDDNDRAFLRARERFDRLRPTFGSLWKTMAAAQPHPPNQRRRHGNASQTEYPFPSMASSVPSLLPAILQGETVSLRVPPTHNNVDCPSLLEGCVDCETCTNTDPVMMVVEEREDHAIGETARGSDAGFERNHHNGPTGVSSFQQTQAVMGGPFRAQQQNTSSKSDDDEDDATYYEGDTVRGAGSSVSSGDTGTSGSTVMNHWNSMVVVEDGDNLSLKKETTMSQSSDDDLLVDFSHIALEDPDEHKTEDEMNAAKELEQQRMESPATKEKPRSRDRRRIVVDLVNSDSSDGEPVVVVGKTKNRPPATHSSKLAHASPQGRKKIVIESSSSSEDEWSGSELHDKGGLDHNEQDDEASWLVNDGGDEWVQNTNIPSRTDTGLSKGAFRKQRETLAQDTLKEFDDKAFNGTLGSVAVIWSNKLRTTSGLTRLKRTTSVAKGVVRSASIELSTKVIDSESRLRATLLHELCHAAAWLIDGVSKPPHGQCFQKWARKAMGRVPDVVVTTRHDYEIAYKFAWACTTQKCGAIVKRHSRSVDVNRQCCGRCKGRLIEIEVPSGTGPMVVAKTPRKKAPLSEYNRFVKLNTTKVRAELGKDRVRKGKALKVTQQEVMKECARRWREYKQDSQEEEN